MQNARRYNMVILLLLIAGWIFPSIQPPYGVALASTGLRDLEYYWNYVCVGNAGYFSNSPLVEDTWEQGSHGHSFMVGQCIPANLLSILVPLSAALIIYFVRSKKSLLGVWRWIIVVLALMGIFLSYTTWQFPKESVILAVVFIGFELYMIILERRTKRRNRDVVDVSSRNILLFYPIWILALALTQQVIPFAGLVLTMIGCLMLAGRKIDPVSDGLTTVANPIA